MSFSFLILVSILSILLSKYSFSNSQPLKSLLLFKEAIAVVALPEKQSKTTSPSLECFLINSSIKANGFWVGWNLSFSWQIG